MDFFSQHVAEFGVLYTASVVFAAWSCFTNKYRKISVTLFILMYAVYGLSYGQEQLEWAYIRMPVNANFFTMKLAFFGVFLLHFIAVPFCMFALYVAVHALRCHRPILRVIDDSEFVESFKPVKNHFVDDCSWDGCMFETFGKELAYVRSVFEGDPRKVWTVLDVDGDLIVENGFHFINRFGYIVTEIPAPDAMTIKVVDA